jgi:hypothetical protein
MEGDSGEGSAVLLEGLRTHLLGTTLLLLVQELAWYPALQRVESDNSSSVLGIGDNLVFRIYVWGERRLGASTAFINGV